MDGEAIEIQSPRKGKELGIGIIYQELALVPDLSVSENMFLNRLGGSKGLIHWSDLHQKAKAVLNELGFDIDPRKTVHELSIAYQQIVEIAKVLSEKVKVLILDEPTAVLTPQETERLFDTLKKLKESGVSIIYISHRLEEIFQIADTITTLRDGEVTGTLDPEVASMNEVIELMIGRKLTSLFPKRSCEIGEEILRVEEFHNPPKFRNISFSVRKGEVLGIAGLVGSGRTEVVRAIFGADSKSSGKLILEGKLISVRSPRDAVRHGIGLVPENRKEQGLVLSLPIKQNATMSNLQKITGKFGIIRSKQENVLVDELMKALTVKASSPEMHAENLSGGNQQKVVLAKWFNTDCKVILLDEPTRGVDVGAKTEIYQLVNEMAAKGLGVIVISSELMEIIGLCDRAMVMGNGEIKGVLEKENMSEKNIMEIAIGGTSYA
ncbi:sugar ABC transporter ATP-binding protein [Paenibacillus sp. N3.4]|uniref:sugar ABC transporter ATP-binding protein n=1 Tax=Paenibacillus sp. N3.4 TaxID=2603222 RepID=UPI0021C323A5|nr:sugar ABC transporter ATP-binding protein [Paenibacillus sp. N3.4]